MKLYCLIFALLGTAALADNTTTISRLRVDHPNLGHVGGAPLHSHIADIYRKIGDNMDSRYEEWTGIANSGTVTHNHNFNVAFAELRILLYSGTGSSKTRIEDPAGSGWTIVATSGFTLTQIDITAPGSGGPHDFSVIVVNGNEIFTAPESRSHLSVRSQSQLRLKDSDNSNYLAFRAPSSVSADVTWTYPGTDGSNGQVLSTNGSGVLSWMTALNDPMTTRGDLITRNSSNVTSRIAVGTTGQILQTTNGLDPSWAKIVDANVDNAAVISGSKLQAATGSNAGAVTTVAQTFAGDKTNTGDVIASSGLLNRRLDNLDANMVINGNFDYWQRGTSIAAASGGVYLADRWIGNTNQAVTLTMSQSTDVPTQAQSGYLSRYSLLLTNGTGAAPGTTEFQQIGYRMEGQDYQRLHGKAFRIQFWTKSSITGTFAVALYNGSYNRVYISSFTVSSANTWELKSFDVTGDTSGTWNIDHTLGLELDITLTAGTTYQTATLNTWGSTFYAGSTSQTQFSATTGATFRLAQVMIVPNNLTSSTSGISIPFRRATTSITSELALCQRYFEKSYDIAVTPDTNTSNGSLGTQSNANGDAVVTVPFKVKKRLGLGTAIQTTNTATGIRFYRNTTGNLAAFSAAIATSGEHGFVLTVGALGANNLNSLLFHYQANAEL